MAIKTRVKICGITSVNDAAMVAEAGTDAIGLNFYEPSPRYIDVKLARSITREVGPFVTVVGLFVDADPAFVRQVCDNNGITMLQFHGNETAEYCEQFNLPYMKALRMRDGLDVLEAANRYANASGILLDAYRKGVPGGTGESFDWARVPNNLKQPLVLAGGLVPENVISATQQVQPYALDVSGGVESSPGIKDQQKVQQFIENTKAAHANL